MSHQEKQRIFDEYAKSQEYADWKSLEFEFEIFLMNVDEFMLHVFAACDLVQEQQQKRIKDKARLTVKTEHGESEAVGFNYGNETAWINVDSILNPENKIQ